MKDRFLILIRMCSHELDIISEIKIFGRELIFEYYSSPLPCMNFGIDKKVQNPYDIIKIFKKDRSIIKVCNGKIFNNGRLACNERVED